MIIAAVIAFLIFGLVLRCIGRRLSIRQACRRDQAQQERTVKERLAKIFGKLRFGGGAKAKRRGLVQRQIIGIDIERAEDSGDQARVGNEVGTEMEEFRLTVPQDPPPPYTKD